MVIRSVQDSVSLILGWTEGPGLPSLKLHCAKQVDLFSCRTFLKCLSHQLVQPLPAQSTQPSALSSALPSVWCHPFCHCCQQLHSQRRARSLAVLVCAIHTAISVVVRASVHTVIHWHLVGASAVSAAAIPVCSQVSAVLCAVVCAIVSTAVGVCFSRIPFSIVSENRTWICEACLLERCDETEQLTNVFLVVFPILDLWFLDGSWCQDLHKSRLVEE